MTAYENTDKEIWRKIEGEYYSPRIFVTKEGNVGINVGGNAYVQSVEEWHKQADRIAELEKENANLKYEISSGAWQPKEATDQELFNIYAHLQDTYEGNNFPVALGRKILKLYATPQTKPLTDEEIEKIAKQHLAAYAQFIGAGEVCYEGEIEFARAIEERHGIK